VLEEETRMGNVKLLALPDRWRLDITLSHLQEIAFVIDFSLVQGPTDLLIAALDPNRREACHSRHSAGELPEAGAEVDHTLTLQERSL
jgi:hypothetical protein